MSLFQNGTNCGFRERRKKCMNESSAADLCPEFQLVQLLVEGVYDVEGRLDGTASLVHNRGRNRRLHTFYLLPKTLQLLKQSNFKITPKHRASNRLCGIAEQARGQTSYFRHYYSYCYLISLKYLPILYRLYHTKVRFVRKATR